MSRSDETYLESLIELFSTLPHEVRRNLELMKDLDKSCSTLFEDMTKLQQEYVQRVQDKVCQLEIVDGEGVRVKNGGSDDPVVIPTTEELAAYIREKATYGEIERVQTDALQRAEEKVAIAHQTYSLVDSTCTRLDNDLMELEKILQNVGGFQAPGTAKPDDLAAIQVIPGSPDWILAKVITHDPQTSIYKLSDEDVESSKIFNLPESQVVILGGLKNLKNGDNIYAVYPDTTSFYHATAVQAPRKVSGGGSFVMVNFVDDSDEHGITHDKAVLMKYVMLPPYGATAP